MRETSNSFFNQDSQQPKQFRGGEKKVMKKSLSLLVAIAMVFSMFAAVASAAETTKTTEQKYEELVAAGIFSGMDDGEAHLDKNMTRAQAARIIAVITGFEKGTEVKDAGYTDLKGAGWAEEYINYATEIGVLKGKGNNKFDPSAEFKIEELAVVVAKLADFVKTELPAGEAVEGKVDEWAAKQVASVVASGILAEQDDYTVAANRGLLVDVVYEAKQMIESAGALTIAKVEQTDATEITVSFNKEVTAEQKSDLTFALKNGQVAYTVTSKYAADNKSVVLSSTYLPAGEYELTVKGFDAKKVTIEEEKATKIEIGASALQRAENQDIGAKLLNQFGKEVANANLNISVYNASKGTPVNAGSDGKFDLTGGVNTNVTPNRPNFDVDDSVVVTVTHVSGLSSTKTFKLVAGSAATSIKFGTIQPLEGKSRISAGDTGVVVPVELFDQYGNKIKLVEKTIDFTQLSGNDKTIFDLSGVMFTLSQPDVVSKLVVDKDGIVTIDVDAATTLVIHAINPSTGANGSTSVKIEGAPVVKTLTINQASKLLTAEEDIHLNITAVDSFNDPMKAKDIVINNTGNFQKDQVQFNSSVQFANNPKINAKGELVLHFQPVTVKTNAIVSAFVNGQQVGQIILVINPVSTPKKVTGIKDVLTTIANGVSVNFNKDKVVVADNYGRTAAASELLDTTTTDKVFVTATGTSATLETDGNGNVTQIKAVGVGVTKFKVEIEGVSGSSYEFSVNVVKPEDVKSYSIKAIDTLYGGDNAEATHAKDVVLVGKIGSTEVAIDQATAFDFVAAEGNASVIVANKKVYGVGEGDAKIIAFKDGQKLAEITVKVSKAAPVITKVEFEKSEYEMSSGTITPVIKVTDQYGVAVATPNGILSSSDKDVATVASGIVTKVGTGQTTLTFVTTNNLTATATLTVN